MSISRPTVRRSALVATTALLGMAALSATLTRATTPGANGLIVFERFAGAHEDDHTSQLFTRSAAGQEQQLTSLAGGSFQPAFSPDGTRVAFTRWYVRAHEPDQVFTMNADGTDVRRLTSGCTRAKCLFDDWPHYSPDGTQIAFLRVQKPLLHRIYRFTVPGGPNKGKPGVDKYDYAGGTDVMAVPAAGGAPTLIHHFGRDPQAGDGGVAWSPDGARLVLALSSFKHPTKHTKQTNALFVMDAHGAALRRITPWAIGAANADWAPDGSAIAFESQGGHSHNLYVVHPDGSQLKQLVKGNAAGGIGQPHAPAWSPDGSQIIFTAPATGRTENTDIYSMNPDGTNLHPIVTGAQAEGRAAWQPVR